MLNDPITPLLVLVGVLGSAYLTYKGTIYKYTQKPKNPTTELFNYYEQMLKNVWEQSQEKDKLIDKLELSMNRIQEELWETKNLLIETKQKLAEASHIAEQFQKNLSESKLELGRKMSGV